MMNHILYENPNKLIAAVSSWVLWFGKVEVQFPTSFSNFSILVNFTIIITFEIILKIKMKELYGPGIMFQVIYPTDLKT